MIIVKNRELLIPNNERYIGTTYDNDTENRVFQVPRFSQRGVDLANLTFRLDIQYANESYDTVVLDKEVGEAFVILIWRITSATLQVPGTLYIGLRAIDDEATVKWSSFSAAMYAERHLNTPGNYGGSLTEIEQMEQDHVYMKGVVDELKSHLDYTHEAEAWAIGKKDGEDVPSTDETYHNNSKYYSDQASTKATQAANSATAAANSATQAAETVSDTNTRFNNAVEAVTSETEVIDARVGADGTQYTVLKNRLDTEHNQLKSQLRAISPEMTTFVKREIAEKSATTFAEIDHAYVEYPGKVFANDGLFVNSSVNNSYAFVAPYDNFAFITNANRICIANAYPDTTNNIIDIKNVLKYGTDTIETVNIPNKGDIVVVSVGTSVKLLLLTIMPIPTYIDTLFLKESNDRFAISSVKDTAVSDVGNQKLNIVKVPNTIVVSNTAGYDTNASYSTWYFKVPVATLTIKCTNGFRAAIGYNEPSPTSQVSNLKRLLYQYEAGRVETFTASYGDWIVISVPNSRGEIDLKTDYVTFFKMPALKLGFRQSNSFYRYASDASGKYLYIYYKSGEKYIRWVLHNVPATGINSDTWQIGHVCGLDANIANEVELVAGGEFELAFKEHGASDFCGGNNHGDETTDTFILFIDGKKVTDLSNLDADFHAFNRIDAFEIATINRCDTPSEDIATHQKVWIFENGTVKVKQTIKFLEQLQVDGMLICMFAANRSAFTHGLRWGNVGIENMTDNTYTILRTKINNMFYEMYGTNTTAKISANSFNDDGDSGLWINPTSVLNKLYFTYWEDSNSTFPKTVNANTVLHWESEYDVAYN